MLRLFLGLNEDSLDQLLRFIEGLRARGMLSRDDCNLLKDLLFQDSTLIVAAYSVAISANDPEYLAEICKDLAQSLKSSSGKRTLESQGNLLSLCNALFNAHRITENQLLYLRHLVLIRDRVIARVYANYASSNDTDELAQALHAIALTHPYMEGTASDNSTSSSSSSSSSSESESSSSTDGSAAISYGFHGTPEDGRSEATGTTDPLSHTAQIAPETDSCMDSKPTSVVSVPMLNTMQSLAVLLLRARLITSEEAMVLSKLVNAENEYLIGAYELFEQNGDLDDLQDTVIRCIRAEMRRAHMEAEENGYGSQSDSSDDSSSGSESTSSTSTSGESGASSDVDSSSEEADNEQTSADEEDASEFENVEERKLESLLSELKVKNVWRQADIPLRFMTIVFYAAKSKLLAVGQAIALCDLFQAKYDLVLAAWQVFLVQNDASDFLDTLLRIVRDLKFDNDGNVQFTYVNAAGETESIPEDAEEARKQIRSSVEEAKMDLLRHTVAVMVKQSIITEAAALRLLKRALQGDVLIDTAVHSYAKDRNIMEFLDTLQVLAEHTQEELQAMLSKRIYDNPQEEEDDEEDDDEEEDGDDASSESEEAEEEEESGGGSSDDDSEDSTVDNSAPGATAAARAELSQMQRQFHLQELISELFKQTLINREGALALMRLNQANDDIMKDIVMNFMCVSSLCCLVRLASCVCVGKPMIRIVSS